MLSAPLTIRNIPLPSQMGSGASKKKQEPAHAAGKDKMYAEMTEQEQAAVQTLGWSGCAFVTASAVVLRRGSCAELYVALVLNCTGPPGTRAKTARPSRKVGHTYRMRREMRR